MFDGRRSSSENNTNGAQSGGIDYSLNRHMSSDVGDIKVNGHWSVVSLWSGQFITRNGFKSLNLLA